MDQRYALQSESRTELRPILLDCADSRETSLIAGDRLKANRSPAYHLRCAKRAGAYFLRRLFIEICFFTAGCFVIEA